ncbi:MAG: PorP/SprF family type IX secretion system membrane protein [Flavobacteriales bacterium]|nr:PorP/SprF family type IX secretion system membrane protein [Flavobacteriales bacterium]MCB9198413.1 PorP/SprF family type IX secretion system membrane protein [Flavobacteriales bacterium]
MKKLLILLSVFFCSNVFGQDPIFYSSNTIQLYNNPAFAGLNKSFSMDFGCRNQWPELSGNYVSSVTSVNQFLGKGNGISIQVFTDNAAQVIYKTEIDLGYAKTIKLMDKHFLSIGVQFAYYQKHFNFNNLTFGDMIDPRRGFVYSTGEIPYMDIGNFDAHIGLVYYNEVFYVSLSSKHLLRPIESFYDGNNRLPILYFTEVGGKYQLNDFRFVPLIRL